MLNSVFTSILANGTFTGTQFAALIITSILCGLFIAVANSVKNRSTSSMFATLTLLPTVVCVVILLVNGNLGAGVAVAGAFSLVRFRSAPGRGRDITSIFLAMTVGLATGMGYLGVAVIVTAIVSVLRMLLSVSGLGNSGEGERVLKITVPENLDFEGRFEDIFERYFSNYEYEEVKTASMGSLYKLTLRVTPLAGVSVKALMDEIRTRNGNLDVSMGRVVEAPESL